MNFFTKTLMAATLLGGTVASSQAALTNFTDYNLGGTTASWDIFYGGNYLPAFSYLTGTAGNPILDSPSNLTLGVQIVGFKPSFPGPNYATGPLDSDGGTVPGNREEFYTFFSSNGAWSINMVALSDVSQVVLQIHEIDVTESAISAIYLNGTAGVLSFDETLAVSTWSWNGLGVSSGENMALTWSTGEHASFDAFQVQIDAQVVPEPSILALAGLSTAAFLMRRRVRSRE